MASRVIIKGITKFKTTQFKTIQELSERQLEVLAKETEILIQRKITESIQRPGSTGDLANSFFAEQTINGWGIGNISFLNQNAKQWYWINYGVAQTGRSIPPNTKGTFSPGNPKPDSSSFRNGRFKQSSNGYLMKPNKPIEPHNFIARTLQQIPILISNVLSKVKL